MVWRVRVPVGFSISGTADLWETLESGPVTIHGLPMTTREAFEPIPGVYAAVRRRAAAA